MSNLAFLPVLERPQEVFEVGYEGRVAVVDERPQKGVRQGKCDELIWKPPSLKVYLAVDLQKSSNADFLRLGCLLGSSAVRSRQAEFLRKDQFVDLKSEFCRGSEEKRARGWFIKSQGLHALDDFLQSDF